MASARDQAASVSPRRMDQYHGEHIPGSLRRTVSSCRIAILRLPDNYNRRIGLQTGVGGARMHAYACMRLGRADMSILATSLRKAINNSNTKLMMETKTSQYMHDIELHFTEKEKRTQTSKLKRFLSKSKGCSDEEIYHWFTM